MASGATEHSPSFWRALLRAVLDPSTYDLRENAGLWLGFGAALPIPLLTLMLHASAPVVFLAMLAPFGWGVIVGSARRVGILSEDAIRRMRLEAITEARSRDQIDVGLRSEADAERTARRKVEQLQLLADAELALAEVIHSSLISPGLSAAGVRVVVRHVPHAFVGGDYVQAVLLRDDLLYLCVGDVAGHGVAAALVVSRFHALVHQLVLQDAGPGGLIEALQEAASHLLAHTALYITFAVFRIDLSARSITYATAGHPAQLLLRSSGRVEDLSTPNPCIGLNPGVRTGTCAVGIAEYAPGDTLLLFTDGLFEAREVGGGGGVWGEDALKALFARVGGAEEDEVASRLLKEVEQYRGSPGADDDVTLVVARFGEAARPRTDPGT